MRNRAQAALEATVAFAIMVILLFSLLKIWKKWADKIIEKQESYSGSRVSNASEPSTPLPPYMP